MKPIASISRICALAASITCLTSVNAQNFYAANSSYYAEVGLSPMELKEDNQNYHPNSMRLIVGKNLNRNFAIEGFYQFTIDSDNQPRFDAKSNHYGIALKPQIGMNESTDLFMRVGYGRSNVTSSVNGEKSASDWMYAVGIQTKFTPDVYGQLDYTNYLHKDGLSVQGVGISLGMRY